MEVNMNSIMTIFPYKYNGVWVFDDESKGLEREAFVCGMTEMITKLVKINLKSDVDNGFVMLFSGQPFPGYHAKLEWFESEHGGNWYDCKGINLTGWLCPALFKYFDDTPKEIYVKVLHSMV